MNLRLIALASLALASVGAHAALTTYLPWEAAYSGNGLSGVLFNVNTDGTVTTAMGAHAFKNGVFLANDGVSQFQAAPGTFAGPPAEPNRANWSFDFGWNFGSCLDCSAWLGVDTDFGVGSMLTFGMVGTTSGPTGVSNPESWNMLMPFLSGLGFNPNVESHTTFRLEVRSGQTQAGSLLTASDITVNVPEPGSVALVGAALLGLAAARRRKA